MPKRKLLKRPKKQPAQHERIADVVVDFITIGDKIEDAERVLFLVGDLLQVDDWQAVETGDDLIRAMDKAGQVLKEAIRVILYNQVVGNTPTTHLYRHGALVRLLRASSGLILNSVYLDEAGVHVRYHLTSPPRVDALLGRLILLFLTSKAMSHVAKCDWCGTYFSRRRNDARFCTDSCRARNHQKSKAMEEIDRG